MHRTTSRGLLATLAMLAIGAGQLLAPAAEARLWLDNGMSMNGVVLNGASLNDTGEQNLGAQQPAAAPSRVDAGRLRLRAVRLADGR
jgi:hypothetical protein